MSSMSHTRRRVIDAFLALAVVLFVCIGMIGTASAAPTHTSHTTVDKPVQPVNGRILPQFSAAFARQQMQIVINCRSQCWVTNPTNGLRMLADAHAASAADHAAIAAHYAAKTPKTGYIALGTCSRTYSLWSTNKWNFTGFPFSQANGWFGYHDSVDEQMLNFYDANWVWCAAYGVNTYHCTQTNQAGCNAIYNAYTALPVAGTSEPNGEVNDPTSTGLYWGIQNGYSYHSGYVYVYGDTYQVGGYWAWSCFSGCDNSQMGYNVNHDNPND